jgi:hypothetical protein
MLGAGRREEVQMLWWRVGGRSVAGPGIGDRFSVAVQGADVCRSLPPADRMPTISPDASQREVGPGGHEPPLQGVPHAGSRHCSPSLPLQGRAG